MSRRLNILFSGMIAADPHQGGATWAVLQYLLGLRRLGHDAYFLEYVPTKSLRPAGVSLERSENAAYFRRVVERFGLAGRAGLYVPDTDDTLGLPHDELYEVANRADVLLNVAGMFPFPDEADIPVRVYLDLDPAFVQLWHATQGVDMRLDGHTHFVTVGLNVGLPGCDVPACGRQWVHTLPPVVLERWPSGGGLPRLGAFTTVANWRAYGSIEYGGVHYGQKAHSLRKLIGLPRMTRERFDLVLNIHPDEKQDLAALEANGWNLLDPAVAGDPTRYGDFIRLSKAEFGLAKSGYVNSRCGWFSDRSACYLASGRPVVAQDTGWSRHLPSGTGLFPFETAEDVVAAADAIDADYPRHCAAARRIAEEYFDSDVVLPRLLEAVGAS